MDKFCHITNMLSTILIKYHISTSDNLRVIIGAGNTRYPGWISTDYRTLDITQENSWITLFKSKKIDALLSEHVFEHLTINQLTSALNNAYRFMKHGGYIRIAVPDGFHPDRDYIDMVKPGGSGSGSDDHKLLLNSVTLSKLLHKTGFSVQLLEWFDHDGCFHRNEWNKHEGTISRSSENDARNIHSHLSYTSLIIDAYKP